MALNFPANPALNSTIHQVEWYTHGWREMDFKGATSGSQPILLMKTATLLSLVT